MTFVIKIVQMLLILGRRNPVDRLETFREVSGRGETGSVSDLTHRIRILPQQLGRLIQAIGTQELDGCGSGKLLDLPVKVPQDNPKVSLSFSTLYSGSA